MKRRWMWALALVVLVLALVMVDTNPTQYNCDPAYSESCS